MKWRVSLAPVALNCASHVDIQGHRQAALRCSNIATLFDIASAPAGAQCVDAADLVVSAIIMKLSLKGAFSLERQCLGVVRDGLATRIALKNRVYRG